MTFEIPNPHDACFKDLFSRPEFVQSFIENYMPFEIRSLLDLETMEIDLTGFVSEEHREFYSDVTETVQIKDDPEFVSIYFSSIFIILNLKQSSRRSMLSWRRSRT